MTSDNTASSRNDAALLVARLFMASLFLWSGSEKLVYTEGAAKFASMHGIPYALQLMPFAALFEIATGLMIALGWRAREAAIALALWMFVLGPWFHQFWNVPPQMWQAMIDSFFHHYVMIGGMIYLAVFGPGRLALAPNDGRKFGRDANSSNHDSSSGPRDPSMDLSK